MDTMDMQDQPAPVIEEPKKAKGGGVGPVLGIIVIIILIALGGLYYFTKSTHTNIDATVQTP